MPLRIFFQELIVDFSFRLFVNATVCANLVESLGIFECGKNCFPTLIETVEVCSLDQTTGRLQEVVGHFRPMV
jgi:hypothetical protein